MISKSTVTEMIKDPQLLVQFYRPRDIDPKVVKSDVEICWCCGSAVVGSVTYTADNRSEVHELVLGVPALFVGHICSTCEDKFTRNKAPVVKSLIEKIHDQQYRQFLQHKLYPEVKFQNVQGEVMSNKVTKAGKGVMGCGCGLMLVGLGLTLLAVCGGIMLMGV